MKTQLEQRRQWHLAKIQELTDDIREHATAVAELERLLRVWHAHQRPVHSPTPRPGGPR